MHSYAALDMYGTCMLEKCCVTCRGMWCVYGSCSVNEDGVPLYVLALSGDRGGLNDVDIGCRISVHPSKAFSCPFLLRIQLPHPELPHPCDVS